MTTDFEKQEDILVRIDRTWRSLNVDEVRLLLLEARSEIRTLRRSAVVSARMWKEAADEVKRLQESQRDR